MPAPHPYPPTAGRATPLLTVLACALAAFVLSCRLLALQPPFQPGEPRGVAAALVGNSRLGLSAHFYGLADLYFHKGIPDETKEAFDDTWIQALQHAVRPRVHVHRHGREVGEIMPWLELAARLDPHNLEAILVAAFWMARDARQPDLADNLLRRAQADNPFNYLIQVERGRIGLMRGDVDAARRAFDAALAFWPGSGAPDDPDTLDDKARILLYRALIYEVDGERDAAVAALREIVALHPERASLKQRIETLERGETPELMGAGMWNNLLQKEADAHKLCHREGEHHAHDH